MNGFKKDYVLASTAVVLCAALGIAWSVGLFADNGSSMIRIGTSVVVLGLAGGAVAILLYGIRHDHRDIERHLGTLCRLDPRDFHSDVTVGTVPPLKRNSPWKPLADCVREALVKLCERVQDLDHSRTALEIRTRRAASQSEQIKAILSGLADPIIAVDEFDELLLANPAAEALFDLDNESAEDRAISQILRCQKLVELLANTCRREGDGNRTAEIEIVDNEGRSQSYHVRATKLSSGGDEGDSLSQASRGAVAVLREVGQQKALQKRNAEFVSAVSHEMKTPLAGIKAYVELLVDGDAEDEETREEFLDVINGQADRLQRLVDNMLNLARIEAGVVNVDKQSRSLNELLEEAAHVVQPSAEAKNIELVTELSPMYLGVLADRDMLFQSAINLLSNAIKYTPNEGRVALRSRLVDDEVTFEVEDTGVGLSEEDCQRVFEKFYRVKKDKEMASGTGLGLPLAKHIVEDVHGGRLSVQSTEGMGSKFTVSLPSCGQMT